MTPGSELKHLDYLDQSAGFDYCISEFGNKFNPSDDPCWQRCFYFPFSDIPGSISDTIQKKFSAGELVIETPQDFAALTALSIPPGTTP
jgi:hypothetical protein